MPRKHRIDREFCSNFFPKKKKTIKYAGNWDPNSKQPLSYRIQKKILSNTFLTKNCKVLVYGKWENSTKNIYPFFTASFQSSEIEEISKTSVKDKLKLIYVGSLTKSKQPILSVKSAEELLKQGLDLELNIFGHGNEYENLKSYIDNNDLENSIFLHGNQEKNSIKKAFQEAHFLIFISKSEGWPKVVAEAMFWGCVPLSSKVSCVPYMLGHGKRGALVDDNVNDIVNKINFYLKNEEIYLRNLEQGKKWSQEITLDKFELEISKLL